VLVIKEESNLLKAVAVVKEIESHEKE